MVNFNIRDRACRSLQLSRHQTDSGSRSQSLCRPDKGMLIQLAQTADAIARCFPVMVQLRPHLTLADFVSQVARQQEDGYHLVYLESEQQMMAVAGFRFCENLAWGKFLYVDDLVTDASVRSEGYGTALLDWLSTYGQQHGCTQLHLDSGVTRHAAHKFYFHQGYIIGGYHFFRDLA